MSEAEGTDGEALKLHLAAGRWCATKSELRGGGNRAGHEVDARIAAVGALDQRVARSRREGHRRVRKQSPGSGRPDYCLKPKSAHEFSTVKNLKHSIFVLYKISTLKNKIVL